MKDAKGREYDGWVAKDPDGRIYAWTLQPTRSVFIARYGGNLWREHRRKYGRRMVKVQLVEVTP